MLIVLSALALWTGCAVDLSLGGGKKEANTSNSSTTTTNNGSTSNNQHPVDPQVIQPTIGQQLIDLKKAKDAGAITDAEYETEKAKLLGTGNK
jgi:hypothetical protein